MVTLAELTLTQDLIIAAISAAGAIAGLLIGFLAQILKSFKTLMSALKDTAQPITKAYDALKTDTDTIQKAIILSQSKDADARKAVVELLSQAKDANVVGAAKAIKEEIQKEVEDKKEVLKKVIDEYTPVD